MVEQAARAQAAKELRAKMKSGMAGMRRCPEDECRQICNIRQKNCPACGFLFPSASELAIKAPRLPKMTREERIRKQEENKQIYKARIKADIEQVANLLADKLDMSAVESMFKVKDHAIVATYGTLFVYNADQLATRTFKRGRRASSLAKLPFTSVVEDTPDGCIFSFANESENVRQVLCLLEPHRPDVVRKAA